MKKNEREQNLDVEIVVVNNIDSRFIYTILDTISFYTITFSVFLIPPLQYIILSFPFIVLCYLSYRFYFLFIFHSFHFLRFHFNDLAYFSSKNFGL